MKKRLFLPLLLFIFSFLIIAFPKTIFATGEEGTEGGTLENPLIQYQNNILDTENTNIDQFIGGKQTKEGKMAGGVVDSLMSKGIILLAGTPDENGKFVGGVIGVSSIALGTLFDQPPASGVTYFADLFHKAGLAKSAYAQGVGFSGLSPILILWQATRNFAYILITVLFIALGLMIMFRIKLSPQSVISVQNAIPKILVTLILVTFSYAIAGLLIDLGNLFLIIIIKVLDSTGFITASNTSSDWLNAGIGHVIVKVFNNLVNGFVGLLFSTPGTSAGVGVATAGIIAFAVFLPAAAGAILAAIGPALLLMLLGILIAIAGLFIKIITMMIKAYVSIILGVVFGPIQIVFDAIPGQKSSAVKSWAKSLLGNILVFPVVAILFIVADFFDAFLSGGSRDIWTPPGFTGGNLMIMSAIKLGILLIIPNVDKVIMQLLDVKTSLGSALGRDPLLGKHDLIGKDLKQSTGRELEKALSSMGNRGGATGGEGWNWVARLFGNSSKF